MLILLDQGTPVPIRRFLTQHTVRTATQQGWATLTNGDLLAAAEADGLDLLVTTDKNLPYQQNLTGRRIAVAFHDFDAYERPLAAAQEVDQRSYAIALLGGEAELRAREIAALEWADVDLDCGTRTGVAN